MKPDSKPGANRTREALLSAGQKILAESGIEAVNSNAIATLAGVTPPTFYRHFENKYELLKTLAERLMGVQNTIILRPNPYAKDDIEEHLNFLRSLWDEVLDVTIAFQGAHGLLVAMRAIPELWSVRINSHENTARASVENLQAVFSEADPEELYTRSRVSMEIGHSIIEMLCESDFHDREAIVEIGARSIYATLADPSI